MFHYTVIETCFEMPKFSELEKLWCYSNYKSSNFDDYSAADPPILFYYLDLRIGGPGYGLGNGHNESQGNQDQSILTA